MQLEDVRRSKLFAQRLEWERIERGLLTSSKQRFSFFLMELVNRTRNSIVLIHTNTRKHVRSDRLDAQPQQQTTNA